MPRSIAIGLLATVVWLWNPALGQAQVKSEIKPEPAWCGGSWQPAMLQEVIKDGKMSTVPIPGTAGTSFAPCTPVTRTMKGADGKEMNISVPTYPAYPASVVTFRQDPKTGEIQGGTMVTAKDKDGKSVTNWEPIKPTIVPAKR